MNLTSLQLLLFCVSRLAGENGLISAFFVASTQNGSLNRITRHNDDGSKSLMLGTESRNSMDGPPTEEPHIVHISFDEPVTPTLRDATKNSTRKNKGMNVPVNPGETILSALERMSTSGGLADTIYPPYDCRRGNCLTCSARHNAKSETNNLIPTNDNGLSPYVAKAIAKKGFVLTCSSTVVGPGVSLTVGANHQLWDFVYKGRFASEATEATARAAMAKAIRRSAERNVEEWSEQTEKAYRNSSSEQE
mmetsp:Transcript_12364/g.34271  ORF Transcript_12364/g.34271 Transcript_12364/m.34271 type:complete len:249 (-) Transcript_12364:12-758(-)